MKAAAFLIGTALVAMPAAAQTSDPLAPLPTQAQPQPQARDEPPAAPIQPSVPVTQPAVIQQPAPQPAPQVVVKIPRDWRGVFDAIRNGQWTAADAGIATLPRSILTPVAKAELFTARGSPTVDLGRLQALLAEAPDLPQADQLARMAITRGATSATIAPKYPLVWLGSAPRRSRARPVQGEPYADQLRAALDPLVKADDAAGAEAMLIQYAPQLSYEARAEAGQRVAWIYYVLGQDVDARRGAETWRPGATGDWAIQSAWISGLASWRLGDCEAASRSFREVGASAGQGELGAAGNYWAARSEQACRRPRSVAPLLRAAARSPESFYGLLARETLGMDKTIPHETRTSTAAVDVLPNVQRARELMKIGLPTLAEEFIEHQAKIGRASDHHALIQVAKDLDLPSAQFWLAHNGQAGAVADAADRYPTPRWKPLGGWRVDPALAFAHVIQESTFHTEAVSPAGAVGLMQVRPGSAGDMARARGMAFSPAMLTQPTANLEFGQSYIEMLRGMTATQGQLPRVIAAYNAGPVPVARWASIYDKGDPLLWIESLPYWETRYYIPAVLRNMWVYQSMARAETPTLSAIAQHRWPSFPNQLTRIATEQGGAPGAAQ